MSIENAPWIKKVQIQRKFEADREIASLLVQGLRLTSLNLSEIYTSHGLSAKSRSGLVQEMHGGFFTKRTGVKVKIERVGIRNHYFAA